MYQLRLLLFTIIVTGEDKGSSAESAGQMDDRKLMTVLLIQWCFWRAF